MRDGPNRQRSAPSAQLWLCIAYKPACEDFLLSVRGPPVEGRLGRTVEAAVGMWKMHQASLYYSLVVAPFKLGTSISRAVHTVLVSRSDAQSRRIVQRPDL